VTFRLDAFGLNIDTE